MHSTVPGRPRVLHHHTCKHLRYRQLILSRARLECKYLDLRSLLIFKYYVTLVNVLDHHEPNSQTRLVIINNNDDNDDYRKKKEELND